MQIKTTLKGEVKLSLTKHEKRVLLQAQTLASQISKNDGDELGTAAALASDNLKLVIDGLEGAADTEVTP